MKQSPPSPRVAGASSQQSSIDLQHQFIELLARTCALRWQRLQASVTERPLDPPCPRGIIR